MVIVDGRHPVLDRLLSSDQFVPNDTKLGVEGVEIVVLTGPNMAGKSTYIRQVALLSLMAQVGFFVPAKEMKLGVVDRIFSRVGASDALTQGHSTFMVEMVETANILNHATAKSLLILDEVGAEPPRPPSTGFPDRLGSGGIFGSKASGPHAYCHPLP